MERVVVSRQPSCPIGRGRDLQLMYVCVCTVNSGDVPSPARAQSPCSEVLECLEPGPADIETRGPRQILLVRADGVIVPSEVFWTP